MPFSADGASAVSAGRASPRSSINFLCRNPPSPDLMSLGSCASGYPREEPSAGKPHARICEGEAEWLSYSTIASGQRSWLDLARHGPLGVGAGIHRRTDTQVRRSDVFSPSTWKRMFDIGFPVQLSGL